MVSRFLHEKKPLRNNTTNNFTIDMYNLHNTGIHNVRNETHINVNIHIVIRVRPCVVTGRSREGVDLL